MGAAGAVFWGCLGLTAYVYAGYPLLLAAWSRLRATPGTGSGEGGGEAGPLPRVSMIIPAYNEEQVIARKILNSL